MGLEWKDIDFENQVIHITRTSQYVHSMGIITKDTKNFSSTRTIRLPDDAFNLLKKYRTWCLELRNGRVFTAAPYVMAVLREQQEWQAKQKVALGDAREEDNLVFTNEIGHYLSAQIVYKEFKRIVTSIGCKETRFHDLRHSYAVAAIHSGDDIKTVCKQSSKMHRISPQSAQK